MTGIEAGGIGLTAYPDDTGDAEAHRAWIMNSSNDACAVCHTDVEVQINFRKGYLLKFNATKSPDGVHSVSNFSVSGTVHLQ